MFKITATGGQEARTVVYFGYPFVVPNGWDFIATDENGEVFCYRGKPVVSDDSGRWKVGSLINRYILLAHVKFEGDWKDSLMEIE